MQKKSALYRIISVPLASRFYQWLVGADRARERLCALYIHPLGKQSVVLDVGCESGDLACFIDSPSYIGIDINALAIREAIKKHGSLGNFIHIDAIEYLEMVELQFDVILASGLIHHMTDNEIEKFLSLATTKLSPNGRLITIDPVYHERQSFLSRIAMHLDRGGNIRRASGYLDTFKRHFPYVESATHTNILRIPYAHYVAQCKNEQ